MSLRLCATLTDHAKVQAVTRGPLTAEVDVGFVVDEVAMGQVTATIIPPLLQTQCDTYHRHHISILEAEGLRPFKS